jgi:hypothetical protein
MVSANDVGLLDITPEDNDVPAGKNFNLEVRAEVGAALHGNGGTYRIDVSLASLSASKPLDKQSITGTYGDAKWTNPGRQAFTVTVPAAATNGEAGQVVQAYAVLVSGNAAAQDTSHVISGTFMLT